MSDTCFLAQHFVKSCTGYWTLTSLELSLWNSTLRGLGRSSLAANHIFHLSYLCYLQADCYLCSFFFTDVLPCLQKSSWLWILPLLSHTLLPWRKQYLSSFLITNISADRLHSVGVEHGSFQYIAVALIHMWTERKKQPPSKIYRWSYHRATVVAFLGGSRMVGRGLLFSMFFQLCCKHKNMNVFWTHIYENTFIYICD